MDDPRQHDTARGYPRAVNNLAVQALLSAYADNKSIVDESSARAAVAEVLATAILDRLLHHCEVTSINGPSYRLKNRLATIERENEVA